MADGEILFGSLGLGAPIFVGGDVDVSEGIFFDSELGEEVGVVFGEFEGVFGKFGEHI